MSGVQNSLDRILEGMVTQLQQVIAPQLVDPYARSQALAMAELLANLLPRVEWRCDQLAEVIKTIREVLGDEVPDPAGMSNEDLVEARRSALAAFAAATASASGISPEEFRAAAARLLEAELSRVRTGMYR